MAALAPIIACEKRPYFPSELQMNEEDPLSFFFDGRQTFQQLFDRAVQHRVPEYTIAIVSDGQGRFKIYDGRHYCGLKLLNAMGENLSEAHSLPLHLYQDDFYLYSIPCFTLKENEVAESDLKSRVFRLFIEKTKECTKSYANTLHALAEVGVNYSATVEDIRNSEYLVGRALKDMGRHKEAAIWFWCAAFRQHKQAPDSLRALKEELAIATS